MSGSSEGNHHSEIDEPLDMLFAHATEIGGSFDREPTVQIGERAYPIYDPEATFEDWVVRHAEALGRDPTGETKNEDLLLLLSLADPDEQDPLLNHSDHILSKISHPGRLLLNYGLVDLARQHPRWSAVRANRPLEIALPTAHYVPVTTEQWAQQAEDFRNAGFVGFALPFPALFYRVGLLCQAIREGREAPNILIYGETGAGKEMMARAIHELAGRPGKFEALNCGGINVELLNSELFGHVKGAFTGASADRKGLFETCHQGTALLDEITRMPPGCQLHLLRFTNDKQLQRIGETEARLVDVVVISACNEDPAQSAVPLAHDLYARLSQRRIDLPSLQKRSGDTPLLVKTFLEKRERGRKIWDYRYPIARWCLHQVESGRITSIRDLESTVGTLADYLEPLRPSDPVKAGVAKARDLRRKLGRELMKSELAGALGVANSTIYDGPHRKIIEQCVQEGIMKPTKIFPKNNVNSPKD